MARRRPKAPPKPLVIVLVLLAALVASLYGKLERWLGSVLTPGRTPAASTEGYLFCFWNVENLFDDRDDRRPPDDEDYDNWFASDPAALDLKLKHLTETLLRLNDGKGPDILALVEVEGVRAADLLRERLNSQLTDDTLHYRHLLMKEVTVGRHIAPVILTRLPVRGDRTQLHGRQMRILEGHVHVNGHDLVLLPSHWTSRVTDKTGERREKYGDQLFGVFHAMFLSNPKVDLLVCGDCNDPPDAPSITEHLHATGDRDAVLHSGGEPRLFNLFADKDASHGWGTLYHAGKWAIFDQICVSPGLLDEEGWTCLPETVQTLATLIRPNDKLRRPWAFGSPKATGERGFSDHFPVTVRLKVQ